MIHGVIDRNKYKLAELVDGGALRETNLGEFGDQSTTLKNDGRLVRLDRNVVAGYETYFEKSIVSFDSNNNPIYGDETIFAQYSRSIDPIVYDNSPHRNVGEQTSNGTLVIFDGGIPLNHIPLPDSQGRVQGDPGWEATFRSELQTDRIDDFHVAGIKPGDSQLSFATMRGVFNEFGVDYPINTNTFEIGNNTVFAGNIANAVDNWFMVGHNGEFWRNGQTNYRHMFHESGLPLYDFGTDTSFFGFNQSGHGMAGNAFDPDVVKVGNTVYLYTNDESFHGGLHRWKISNTEDIKEFNFSISE